MPSSRKRVWIDLDNSPHVPFFAPIIEQLEKRGYSVTVTARDAYQVWELADFFHLKYTRVGRHYGKQRILKILGTCFRALQLAALMRKEKPDLAVAHGSRSQTLACLLLRVPSVAMTDYEFANTTAMLQATWMMLPEVVANAAAEFASKQNVLKYPGIKEDVYAPGFRPDASIRTQLGLAESQLIVTVRPPATEAHYHNPESDVLFEATMDLLTRTSGVKIVMLPRNARQTRAVRESWSSLFASGKAVIPEHAVDGLNLIWHSDLVISGGGTMNREAAALGVPVYSIFRGKIGAVDHYLADTGRMVLLTSAADVQSKIKLVRRPRLAAEATGGSGALQSIVDQIVAILEGRDPKAALPPARRSGQRQSEKASSANARNAAARDTVPLPFALKPDGRNAQ